MRYLFLFFLLSPPAIFGQVPDTLFAEYSGGNVYVVVQTTSQSGEVITRRSPAMDSTRAAERIFNLIRDNELDQVRGIRDLKKVEALTGLYDDVNIELTRLTGAGYPSLARQYLADYFLGYYLATVAGQSVGIRLSPDGTATQVNAQGQPVQGGLSGTWRPITDQSWQLIGFFPTSALPVGERIVQEDPASKKFFTLNTPITFEKIRNL